MDVIILCVTNFATLFCCLYMYVSVYLLDAAVCAIINFLAALNNVSHADVAVPVN